MSATPPEKIYSNSKRVSCDGGGGALGHPRVWLEMGGKGEVECPYCGRLYALTTSQTSGTQTSPSTNQGSTLS